MPQLLDYSLLYLEFPAADLPATKQFYRQAFGWEFQDYGPDYVSFANGPFCGGFFRADGVVPGRSPLVVLTTHELEATQAAVEAAGGLISTPIFSFPGGRRFHFTDPTGNELAVARYE